MADVKRSAVLSEDGLYRYRLDRWWGEGPRLVWVMLNPSTADADVDDPTIRRVMRFSKDWGYDGCTVVNVFAWRATKPDDIPRNDDEAMGPEWAAHVKDVITPTATVVLAWGAHERRACWQLADILTKQPTARVLCLGRTLRLAPKHPLYVRADTEPIPFAVEPTTVIPES